MAIAAIDHWVLVVKDLEATFAFYRKLGLEAGWQERPGGRGTRGRFSAPPTNGLLRLSMRTRWGKRRGRTPGDANRTAMAWVMSVARL